MIVSLQNENLTVSLNQVGAEIISVRDSQNLEYIWDANPNYWKRHAPILFPMVGRLKDDKYDYAGTIYKMYQHGFARDSNFEVVKATDTEAIFLLRANETTKKSYPFDFSLQVTYTLAKATLKVSMLVVNQDQHSMYFSIGAHPGFKIPLEAEKESYDDYEITVNPAKTYPLIRLNDKGLTTGNETEFKFEKHGFIPLRHSLFKNDAQIFDVEDNPKTTFSIQSKQSGHGVAVTAYNNQYFGIWSTYPKLANFVCIEPWWGIADSENSTGFIKNKNDISRLRCGEDFIAKFDIKFF